MTLKPGGSPLKDEVLSMCISSAKQRSLHIKKLIDTALDNIK